MNRLISGGCKNGKSMYAQRITRDEAQAKGLPLYYVATMRPGDDEDLMRVERHRREREGWGFVTVEQHIDICEILKICDNGGVFLLDSITALLANEMFPIYKDQQPWEPDFSATERVKNDLIKLAGATGNTVFVSDYLYGSIRNPVGTEDLSEIYVRGLAQVDRALAKICPIVTEVTFGIPMKYKRIPKYRGECEK